MPKRPLFIGTVDTLFEADDSDYSDVEIDDSYHKELKKFKSGKYDQPLCECFDDSECEGDKNLFENNAIDENIFTIIIFMIIIDIINEENSTKKSAIDELKRIEADDSDDVEMNESFHREMTLFQSDEYDELLFKCGDDSENDEVDVEDIIVMLNEEEKKINRMNESTPSCSKNFPIFSKSNWTEIEASNNECNDDEKLKSKDASFLNTTTGNSNSDSDSYESDDNDLEAQNLKNQELENANNLRNRLKREMANSDDDPEPVARICESTSIPSTSTSIPNEADDSDESYHRELTLFQSNEHDELIFECDPVIDTSKPSTSKNKTVVMNNNVTDSSGPSTSKEIIHALTEPRDIDNDVEYYMAEIEGKIGNSEESDKIIAKFFKKMMTTSVKR